MTMCFFMASAYIFVCTDAAQRRPAAVISVLPGSRVCVVFYDQMGASTQKAVLEVKGHANLVLPYRDNYDEYDGPCCSRSRRCCVTLVLQVRTTSAGQGRNPAFSRCGSSCKC